MSKIIANNSQMKCSSGSAPASIKVTSQTSHKVSGQLIATEKDKASMSNIPNFGNCKSQPKDPPCVPSPTSWSKVSTITSINGAKALLQISECSCAKGGKITFVGSGSNSQSESK